MPNNEIDDIKVTQGIKKVEALEVARMKEFKVEVNKEYKFKSPIIFNFMSPEMNMASKFKELGGANALGEPIRKEAFIWFFGNGSCICHNHKLFKSFYVHGAIYAKWMSLGGMKFGIPSTDEISTPDKIGRYNHFNNNTASIYWTPNTGAVAIWGDIRKKWVSLGAERSYLGYPISDEVDFAEGGRANEFQNGGIYWWPDTGAIDLRDVIVHYTGLYCFGETDWDQGSTEDEPYAIISVSTPRIAATYTTQVYGDVDCGDSRPDLMEIYRGKPYGINIGIAMMENDFGDPNRYKEEIHKTVMAVHNAGVVALGLIPIVGPFVATVAGPALGALMPSVSNAINDLFDFGDDKIGGANMTISAKQMILLAARTNNSQFYNLGYKLESDLMSGGGASYKAYFGVVPA